METAHLGTPTPGGAYEGCSYSPLVRKGANGAQVAPLKRHAVAGSGVDPSPRWPASGSHSPEWWLGCHRTTTLFGLPNSGGMSAGIRGGQLV